MKKKICLIFSFCLILLLTFTGCGNKTSISTSDFKSTMEDKKFTVQDATDQFEKGVVEQVYLALNDNYQIEFYKTVDESQAITAFNQNKSNFESTSSSSKVETNVSLGNHSKYTLKSGGKYMVISRIDDTFIYLNVDEKYESEIDGILDNWDY